MKRVLIILMLMVVTMTVSAQHRPQFDPAKFDADLEQFITT